MELNFQVGNPPKELSTLQDNYDAFNKMMANMELCGVFSDKLITRTYSIAWRALDVRVEQTKGAIPTEKADVILNKLFTEFTNLFDTYNIFSEEFKKITYALFHTVCFYHKRK
jgi:hypothetical protein